MKIRVKISIPALIIMLIIGSAMPFRLILAANPSSLYFGGWIPFWRQASGTLDIALNLEKLDEVSPFSYEVKPDGTLADKLKISNEPWWQTWFKALRDAKIKIIPTIAWFRGQEIHKLLSNKKTRLAHEDAIKKLVKENNFDGIDIDYEGKLSETRTYFSLLIEGLAIRLHPLKKTLTCTIESRTPLESLIKKGVSKEEIKRANDYKILNKYCDEVRLMAYDQGIIDPFLNIEKGVGAPYAPVADPAWVEKILKEALKEINPKKIMLGIPTYGYEYSLSRGGGEWNYDRLRSYTFKQAMDLAKKMNIEPQRNNAGELNFFYLPASLAANPSTQNSFLLLASAANNLLSMAQKMSGASSTALSSVIENSSSTVRFVNFSDAKAVEDKIKLAKKYKLRGVILFKLDGELDPQIWKVMK